MNGGHQTTDDAELFMNHLGQRGQTVGSATGVGDDVFPGIVDVVHTHDVHRCGVLGRSAHHNAACTSLDVGAGLVISEKKSSALQYIVGTDISPTNLPWIPLRSNPNWLAIHD